MKSKIKMATLIALTTSLGLSSCSEEEKTPAPSGPTYSEVTTYETVLLTERNNPTSLAGFSFFDASTGSTFSIDSAEQVQAKVDMVYYFGSISLDSATIASPNAAVFANTLVSVNPWPQILNWTIKNDTKFKNITDSVSHHEVDDALNDSIIQKYAVNLTDTKISNLEVDDVIAFETIWGKKGTFVVESIDGTTAINRSLTLAVKIQK